MIRLDLNGFTDNAAKAAAGTTSTTAPTTNALINRIEDLKLNGNWVGLKDVQRKLNERITYIDSKSNGCMAPFYYLFGNYKADQQEKSCLTDFIIRVKKASFEVALAPLKKTDAGKNIPFTNIESLTPDQLINVIQILRFKGDWDGLETFQTNLKTRTSSIDTDLNSRFSSIYYFFRNSLKTKLLLEKEYIKDCLSIIMVAKDIHATLNHNPAKEKEEREINEHINASIHGRQPPVNQKPSNGNKPHEPKTYPIGEVVDVGQDFIGRLLPNVGQVPAAPAAPGAPEAPSAPGAPEAPAAPGAPEAPGAPGAPEAPGTNIPAGPTSDLLPGEPAAPFDLSKLATRNDVLKNMQAVKTYIINSEAYFNPIQKQIEAWNKQKASMAASLKDDGKELANKKVKLQNLEKCLSSLRKKQKDGIVKFTYKKLLVGDTPITLFSDDKLSEINKKLIAQNATPISNYFKISTAIKSLEEMVEQAKEKLEATKTAVTAATEALEIEKNKKSDLFPEIKMSDLETLITKKLDILGKWIRKEKSANQKEVTPKKPAEATPVKDQDLVFSEQAADFQRLVGLREEDGNAFAIFFDKVTLANE